MATGTVPPETDISSPSPAPEFVPLNEFLKTTTKPPLKTSPKIPTVGKIGQDGKPVKVAKHVGNPEGHNGKPKPQKTKHKREISLPEALMKTRVTPKNLASGIYQKKILAWFAPYIAPKLMNSILRGLQDDDPAARRLAAEMMNFVTTGKGSINIALSQTNQTANVRQVADDGAFRSFEDIQRMLHEKRQRLALLPAEPIYDATPED